MQQIHNLRFGQAYYEHATNFFSSALINYLFFKIKFESWGAAYLRVQLRYTCTQVFTVICGNCLLCFAESITMES